jgi:hypothetical protein
MQEELVVVAKKTKQFDYSYNRQMSLGGTFTMSSFASNLLIDQLLYNYMPLVFEGFFSVPIFKRAKRNQLAFYVQPGITAVILKNSQYGLPGLAAAINFDDDLNYNQLKQFKTGWEIGFHMGFLHQVLIISDLIFFYGMGSGPHYFPIQNDNRQTPKFIFASHVLFGLKSRLSFTKHLKKIEMSFQIRYRHLSNGQIYPHNQGLDNIMLGIGLAYLFQESK